MKNFITLILSFTMSLVFSFSYGQAIPNSDFETWNTTTSYPNPVSWDTPNPELSTFPGVNGNYVVNQSTTNPHGGTSSILLQTRQYTIPTTFSFPGVITLGNFTVNIVTQAITISGGVTFSSRPDYLKGFFKYLPTGTDFATIKVYLYDYNTVTQTINDTIGEGTFLANGTTSSWTEFQANIVYSSTATPNLMNIVAVSSNPTTPVAGSQLFLDDFQFVTTEPADLFISEYVEGAGGNNKVIELFNPTTGTLDLTPYQVKLAANGGGYNATILQLAGTLAPGAVYVISNPSSEAGILAVTDTTHSVTFLNGDDAIGLFKNNVVIDVFGVQGVDPGTAWNAAGVTNATVDHTMVRKPSVTHGNTDWALQAGTDATNSEWIVYAANDFTHIGSHQFGNVNLLPTISGVNFNPGLVTASDPVVISASITDADGTIASAVLNWGPSTSYSNQATMTISTGNIYSNFSSPIPAQILGTVIYYQIVATDDDGGITEFTSSYTVVPPPPVKTIYEIQYTTLAGGASTLDNTVVQTHGIITGVHSAGYFIQSGSGQWNGVYVYDPAHQPAVGDSISITGLVSEYNSMTEIKNIAIFNVLSTGNTLPAPVLVTTLDVSGNEAWEGVLIKVNLATCTSINTSSFTWDVNDGSGAAKVNNLLYSGLALVLNNQYMVTGPVYYSQSEFRIEPRNATDVVLQTLSSENDITGFSVSGQIGNSTVNPVNHTVTATVLFGTNVTTLTATIGVSANATVSPVSGSVIDFTSPVNITVTAQDGTVQIWVVSISIAPPSAENAILSFSIPGQLGITDLDAGTFSLTVTMPYATNVTALVPTIVVSPGATINPASGTPQDFTNPVSYSVTAQTSAVQVWTATVVLADPINGGVFFSEYIEGSSNNKALEFVNATPSTINLDNYRIAISNNGGGWSAYHTFPTGATLAPLDVWVMLASEATLFPTADADEVIAFGVTGDPVHFNGNDARALQFTPDGGSTWETLDVIGTPDVNPGTAWPVAGIATATLDHTIIRKPTILQGNTDWTLSSGTDATNSEWMVNAQNDFTNLGIHNIGGNIAPVISSVTLFPSLVTPTDTVIVAAQISDLDGTISNVTFNWDLVAGTYSNTLPIISALGVYSTYPASIPEQVLGTVVYFKIVANDDDSDSTVYLGSYTVQLPPQEVTIYQIQGQAAATPFANQTIKTTGIVTAAFTGGYFIQDGSGAWNGIYVYDAVNLPTIGDRILITALATEYYELTELKNVSSYSVISSGNTLPQPVTLSTAAVNTEDYEGVLVRVENATCINDDYGYGMWQVDDGSGFTLIHNNINFTYTPDVGTHYNVIGALNYTFSEFKIEIRMSSDVEVYQSFETPSESQIQIWPVPAVDFLNINTINQINSIRILDLTGKTVFNDISPKSNYTQLNVSSLSPGIYFIESIHKDGILISRFVKQ